jgi:DNA-binding response OmpR family regulator
MDRRVLIIDDDPSMLDLLHAELEQRGYEVVTETSPKAALGAVPSFVENLGWPLRS